MTKLLAAAAALALSAAAVAPALAAPAADAPNQTAVKVSDLNLANPYDAARLMRRLEAAALNVCGADTFSVRTVKLAARHSDCYRDALSNAVAATGSSQLAQLHAGGRY